MGVWINTQ